MMVVILDENFASVVRWRLMLNWCLGAVQCGRKVGLSETRPGASFEHCSMKGIISLQEKELCTHKLVMRRDLF